MKFVYLPHAEVNLADRRISKKIVESSVLNPDEILESKRRRKIAHKIFGMCC
jgi:hypothetical protein